MNSFPLVILVILASTVHGLKEEEVSLMEFEEDLDARGIFGNQDGALRIGTAYGSYPR